MSLEVISWFKILKPKCPLSYTGAGASVALNLDLRTMKAVFFPVNFVVESIQEK